MSLVLEAEAPPLVVDDQGSVRVAGTRVLLDFIVRDHLRGLSAEQIAQRYPTLELRDAYAAISYYLRHRAAVDAYMTRREAEAEDLRTKIERESSFPSKAELLARRNLRGVK